MSCFQEPDIVTYDDSICSLYIGYDNHKIISCNRLQVESENISFHSITHEIIFKWLIISLLDEKPIFLTKTEIISSGLS